MGVSSSVAARFKANCSEFKCYGRYMLPPLLVFGVLVIGTSLIIVGIKRGWF